MTSTTDFSKKQLATILSALDDAPRSPANKGEALRAIGRSAQRFGLTTDDVLAAAPGRGARRPHEPGRLPGRAARPQAQQAPSPADGRPQGAPDAQEAATAASGAAGAAEPAQAATAPAAAKGKAKQGEGGQGGQAGQGCTGRTSPRRAPAPSRPA